MAALAPFGMTVVASDDVVKVAVQGDLDCASGPRLRGMLDALASDRRDMVVDLRSTDFVDCAGIGAIDEAHQRQRQLGQTLRLEAPSRAARRVLELTGLADRIPTTDG